VATNKQIGQLIAVEMAIRKLREKNIQPPRSIKIFGRQLTIESPDYEVKEENVALADRILAYHFLASEGSTEPTGEWISFRAFTGGQFYLEPFRSRTVIPLVKHFKDDLDALRKAMGVFDWEPMTAGDFSAKIKAVENLPLLLVYYRGEDGFEPSADVLFDSAIRRIFCTEDAVVLGTRLCRGLIGQPCDCCSGCGMCDTRR